MSDEPDIEAIARGLTKAQREAVEQLREDGRTGAPDRGKARTRSAILRSMPELVWHRFAGDCRKYYLTETGKALLAYLMENPDGQ